MRHSSCYKLRQTAERHKVNDAVEAFFGKFLNPTDIAEVVSAAVTGGILFALYVHFVRFVVVQKDGVALCSTHSEIYCVLCTSTPKALSLFSM